MNYENSNYGMIFEGDIDYPLNLTLKHEELAFLPERRKINGIEKLVTTLQNKKKHVVHILALKPALKHGLKLRKIHRIIEFEQEDWLKPYILKNTKHRTNAKNEFEKGLFELINNSVWKSNGKY